MRLHGRLDALARSLPPPRVVGDAHGALRKITEWLEQYTPIPPGETYGDVYARLGAALDRLDIPRSGKSLGERIAIALGMTTAEFRAALRARAEGRGR